MNVICVIGDVMGSRDLVDRGAFQIQFQRALDRVNASPGDALASPCTITLGDEFQAVYRHAGPLFQDFLTLLEGIHPARIRFSVGLGPLETPINPAQALGMDGPAFHEAREGFTPEFKKSGRLFRIGRPGKPVPAWIEAGLALVSHEMGTWKRLRFQVINRFLAGEDPRTIAAALGISQTAVYKNIHAGAMGPIRAMTREIADWIDREVQP